MPANVSSLGRLLTANGSARGRAKRLTVAENLEMDCFPEISHFKLQSVESNVFLEDITGRNMTFHLLMHLCWRTKWPLSHINWSWHRTLLLNTENSHLIWLQINLGSLKYFQLNLCILCPETLELSLAELSYCIFISQDNGYPAHEQSCPFLLGKKARFTHKLGKITTNCHHETKSYRDNV